MEREPERWFETPWGRARSLSLDEMRAAERGLRPVTWAELWVLARDYHEDAGAEPDEAAMLATVEVMAERVATVHERVVCPRCHAPQGQPCRRARSQFVRAGVYAVGQPVLKHAHRERLRADGIPDR